MYSTMGQKRKGNRDEVTVIGNAHEEILIGNGYAILIENGLKNMVINEYI